jgi:hypothetical protein
MQQFKVSIQSPCGDKDVLGFYDTWSKVRKELKAWYGRKIKEGWTLQIEITGEPSAVKS